MNQTNPYDDDPTGIREMRLLAIVIGILIFLLGLVIGFLTYSKTHPCLTQ